MLIGKPGAATTSISTADTADVTVRGKSLTTDLMGRLSFTEYFYLLLTGHEPSEQQTFFLDLLLVAIAEHGLVPTNQVARMTLAADPGSLQGAVAAGILGCGPIVLGTAELCGKFLLEARTVMAERGVDAAAAVKLLTSRIHAEGGRVPGFGHPLHKPVDPRAERILELAEAHGAAGAHAALAKASVPAVHAAWGKPLPMNVSMAIAAVLLDLEFPPGMIKAIPILARTGSLLAHLGEEQQHPIGFLMASYAEEAVAYAPGSAS